MKTKIKYKLFRKNLLDWYQKNKRDLPFRKTKDPYKIWLSEIMLQQTTVVTVINYYNRFTKKYPDIQSVTKATEQDLLQHWQGLGYYSRVRNFKHGCQQVLDKFGGKVPQTAKELKQLKGIGDYTAAAIASICFGEKEPVIDGNVKRVISRLFYFTGDPGTSKATEFFKSESAKLLDKKEPGNFNQAMMELGATVCKPTHPQCWICPVQKHCQAKGKNPTSIPQKKKMSYIHTQYASVIIHFKNKVLFKMPQKSNLIPNMWELPSHYAPIKSPIKTWDETFSKQLNVKKLIKTGAVKHAITNKKISTDIYSYAISESQLTKFEHNGFKFLDLKDVANIPLNTLSKKILEKQFREHIQ